ncbi:MAG: hypothetical protein AB1489_20300 [Acidobacteriota bacterium]
MLKVAIGESQGRLLHLPIPIKIAEDEGKLRRYLETVAQYHRLDYPSCFWIKLANGTVKAYFRLAKGMESRTYSAQEITEAIFSRRALFYHRMEEIIDQMANSPIIA